MRKQITAAVVIFFSFVVPVVAQTIGSESVIIIKAARLIDGRGGSPLVPEMVRIEGERIVELASQPGHEALWGARNACITLLAGFTTCREMGPTWPYVDVDLRRAFDDGAVPEPRLLVARNYVISGQ